jgi:uncharacterized membrane protein YgcG
MKPILLLLASLLGAYTAAAPLRAETVQTVDSDKAAAQARIADIAANHRVTVNVRVVESLGGQLVTEYGRQLFESQHMGRDGVLLLVAPTEHKCDIRWGKNLDTRISQYDARGILAKMTARFKQGTINGGIRDGIDELRLVLNAHPATIARVEIIPAARSAKTFDTTPLWIAGGVLVFLVFCLVIAYVSNAKERERRERYEEEMLQARVDKAHAEAQEAARLRNLDRAAGYGSCYPHAVPQQRTCTIPTPVTRTVIVDNTRTGHSTGAVVGAGVAGFAAGILADELYHRRGHDDRRRESDSSPSSDVTGSWSDPSSDNSSSSGGGSDYSPSGGGDSGGGDSSGGGSDW